MLEIKDREHLKKRLVDNLSYYKSVKQSDDIFLRCVVNAVCAVRQSQDKDYTIESEELINDILYCCNNFSDNLITLLTWMENNKNKHD